MLKHFMSVIWSNVNPGIIWWNLSDEISRILLFLIQIIIQLLVIENWALVISRILLLLIQIIIQLLIIENWAQVISRILLFLI